MFQIIILPNLSRFGAQVPLSKFYFSLEILFVQIEEDDKDIEREWENVLSLLQKIRKFSKNVSWIPTVLKKDKMYDLLPLPYFWSPYLGEEEAVEEID